MQSGRPASMTMRRRVMYLAWAPFFSGAERAMLMTLRSLDTSRYEPYVLAGTHGEFAVQVRALGIRCDVVPITPLDRAKPFSSTFSVARVSAAALRFRPAIIHANDMPSYQPGGYAARLLGIPAVTHLRFPDAREGYQWFFRPPFSLAIFISESFRADALREAPELFDGKSKVVYDAVEAPRVWDAAERATRRQELDLPPDRPVVAITGQVSEVKGIWEFVEAADRLRGTKAIFAVLGDDLRTGGALRREMAAKVATLGLGDRFRFLGFRRDAPELVQAFDIVAVPSHVEPFGLASLEAMAAARPVVASRIGGIPEVVRDGHDGILVPARDSRALAEGISRLLEDAPLRLAMGTAGQRRAADVFGMRVHGEALHRVYDQVTRGMKSFQSGEVA
jgi:glycosyltransferase involved in cell wall biosynthesis